MNPRVHFVHRFLHTYILVILAVLCSLFLPFTAHATPDLEYYPGIDGSGNTTYPDISVPEFESYGYTTGGTSVCNGIYQGFPLPASNSYIGGCSNYTNNLTGGSVNMETLADANFGSATDGEYTFGIAAQIGSPYPVIFYAHFYRSGGVWSGSSPPPTEGCTAGTLGNCIETVDPADGQTIATSSLPYDFNVAGYIDTDDYESGARVMIKVDRNTDQQATGALLAFDSAFGNKTYLPIAGGAFDVGTSSENLRTDFPIDRVGLYNVRWEVQSPKFNVFGFSLLYSTLIASSTRFTVGTTTAIDNIQLDQEAYLNNIISQSSGDPLAACQFSIFDTALDFSLGGKLLNCAGGVLHWLFILPPGVLESTLTQLKEGFLTRMPIGYFTRIVSAISGGAAGTLPTVHADIPVPIGDGDISIEFDINQMVEDSATLSDSFQTPDGDSAQDIIEPIIQLMVGLLVLMFIYKDIHSSIRRI